MNGSGRIRHVISSCFHMCRTMPIVRLRIGVLSELYHFWMSPIMRRRGKIEADTLPALPPEDSAAEMLEAFRLRWALRAANADGSGRALRQTIIGLLSPRFYLIGLWNLIDAVANFSQPLIIAALVRAMRLGTFDDLAWLYGLAILLSFAALAAAVSIQQVLWGGARVGMRARIALSAAVYAKTLQLGNAALLQTSAASATNLVAVDVNRLEMSFTFFHLLWYAPLCVFILGVMLYLLVDVATFPGLAFLVVIFYMQRYEIAGFG